MWSDKTIQPNQAQKPKPLSCDLVSYDKFMETLKHDMVMKTEMSNYVIYLFDYLGDFLKKYFF